MAIRYGVKIGMRMEEKYTVNDSAEFFVLLTPRCGYPFDEANTLGSVYERLQNDKDSKFDDDAS